MSDVTVFRLLQFWKALPPMLVTPAGITMDSSAEQLRKVSSSMAVMFGLSSMDTSPVQPSKALLPMTFTDSGILSVVSFRQWPMAPRPMSVTELGISRVSKPVHRWNGPMADWKSVVPISVTVLGMMTCVSAMHSLNARLAIFSTV